MTRYRLAIVPLSLSAQKKTVAERGDIRPLL